MLFVVGTPSDMETLHVSSFSFFFFGDVRDVVRRAPNYFTCLTQALSHTGIVSGKLLGKEHGTTKYVPRSMQVTITK